MQEEPPVSPTFIPRSRNSISNRAPHAPKWETGVHSRVQKRGRESTLTKQRCGRAGGPSSLLSVCSSPFGLLLPRKGHGKDAGAIQEPGSTGRYGREH